MIYCNENKVKNLSKKSNFAIIADFDATLTTANSEKSLRNCTNLFRWRNIRKKKLTI